MEIQRPLFEANPERARSFGDAATRLSAIVTPLAWKAHKDTLLDMGDRVKSDKWFRRLKPGERAQVIHRQIIEEMMDLLREYGRGLTYQWREVHSMNLLCIDDIAVIGFKRFRRDFSRSNYETRHNTEFWSQEDNERPIKLIIGYLPNAAWNDASIYLTLPAGRPGGPALEYMPVADQTERIIHVASTKPLEQLPPPVRAPKRFVLKSKTPASKKGKADSDASDAS